MGRGGHGRKSRCAIRIGRCCAGDIDRLPRSTPSMPVPAKPSSAGNQPRHPRERAPPSSR